MPYAANGMIAEDNFIGAITITDQQYAEALKGMCEGLVVTIHEGFKVALPVADEPPPTPTPTQEELRMFAIAERDRLLAMAALRMAPLQDAIDLNQATQEEISSLGHWKVFRIELNRIDQQPGFPQVIAWPHLPGTSAEQ